ncbi:MAG: hypothetical protein ABI085_06890 [Gemmatimonadaceae bacterium]
MRDVCSVVKSKARHLVETRGGDVRAESDVGRGPTIAVHFPGMMREG